MELNHFDYFSDIEDKFRELRGTHLLLSNLDWELIRQWKDDGVPLQVVLRSIDEVFANHKRKQRRRPIASLSYCKSEVEAQFKEWQAGRVGAHESVPGAVATGSADNSPFPPDQVKEYLACTIESLIRITIERARERTTRHDWETPREEVDTLWAALLAATDELISLAKEYAAAPNARHLEEKLIVVERDLDTAIAAATRATDIAEARTAAEALYNPYKANMPEKVYDQQIDNELKKRLRAIFGVPRLSLFHMKGILSS